MNEFVDMHVHSKFSIDGMSTMEDYCLIAGKTGTRVICFTEHVDFNSAGEVSKYNGLVFCADCGNKHYYSRGRCLDPKNYNLTCSRYHKHMGEEICTPHSIRELVLDEIVLDEINRMIYYARNNRNDFVDLVKKKTSSQLTKDFNTKCSELSKAEQRVKELKTLFKRLYEDNILGRISDEQFRMLASDYTDEQKELELQIPTLRKEIEDLKSECVNTQKFLDVVNKYLYIEELTPTVLRTFISKIVIHERDKKHSKTATQKIDIYFRYIGQFAVPNDYNNTYNEEYTTENAKRTA